MLLKVEDNDILFFTMTLIPIQLHFGISTPLQNGLTP
jgi:hypothetical protein